jgi:hypothetical protein
MEMLLQFRESTHLLTAVVCFSAGLGSYFIFRKFTKKLAWSKLLAWGMLAMSYTLIQFSPDWYQSIIRQSFLRTGIVLVAATDFLLAYLQFKAVQKLLEK